MSRDSFFLFLSLFSQSLDSISYLNFKKKKKANTKKKIRPKGTRKDEKKRAGVLMIALTSLQIPPSSFICNLALIFLIFYSLFSFWFSP